MRGNKSNKTYTDGRDNSESQYLAECKQLANSRKYRIQKQQGLIVQDIVDTAQEMPFNIKVLNPISSYTSLLNSIKFAQYVKFH